MTQMLQQVNKQKENRKMFEITKTLLEVFDELQNYRLLV